MPACSSEPFSSVLCAGFGTKPRIAVCVGGSARTFVTPLVHRSLQENVVHALGAEVTLFGCLDHSGGSLWKDDVSSAPERSESGVIAAAQQAGISHLVVGKGLCGGAAHALPRCHGHTVHTGHYADYAMSFLIQLRFRAGCFKMIRAHEQEQNRSFDAVLFARPDLVWYRAMLPWCYMNFHQARRKQDWVFLVPRALAEAVLWHPYRAYHSCERDFNTSEDIIESWLDKFWRDPTTIAHRVDFPFPPLHDPVLPATISRSGDVGGCALFDLPELIRNGRVRDDDGRDGCQNAVCQLCQKVSHGSNPCGGGGWGVKLSRLSLTKGVTPTVVAPTVDSTLP